MIPLIRDHQGLIAMLAITSVIGGVSEAGFLVILTRAAFAITAGEEQVGLYGTLTVSIGATLLVALLLVVIRMATAASANWYTAALNTGATHELRLRLARSFLRSTWAAQQGSRSGRLQELVTTYSGSGATLLACVGGAIVAGFSLASLLVLAAFVDPVGSLVALAALALLGMLLRPLRRKIQVHARRVANDGMALAVATSEVSGLGMEMHVFDVRGQVEERVVDLLDIGVRSSRRLNVIRGLVPAMYTGLAYLVLTGAVALASIWGAANLRSLGAVMLVMMRSLSYGQQLQIAYSGIQSSTPAVRDLFAEIDSFDARVFVDSGAPVETVFPLELRDVSFHYVDGQPVLADVSAEIAQHELVGVIGPSGSGKSTLVQLLLGLRTPTEGSVLAAGVDIRSLRHADWARKVTFVPQDPVLINGSIADNLRFYRDDITEQDIERAARQAGLHDEVMAFPDRYDHQVGDRGSNLSGGQQQRVCIARALAAHPDLLILDEPTSSLDAKSETLVRDTIDALRSEMSVIVIAHRLSTLDHCDRIMIIQHGSIVGFDSPANLRRSSNFYTETLELSGLS
ncbi:MAG: ABC transporter ATP-binding protein [Actinomycetota bacterium]